MCQPGAVANYDAVLFDWSGTLVHDPTPTDRVRRAFEIAGRPTDAGVIAEMVVRLEAAQLRPDVAEALRDEDTSAARHRAANMLWFEGAGIDPELAHALYLFDEDPAHRPLYSDALGVLAALKARRVKIAIVSDIHFDIRPLLAGQGAGGFIDEYVLSFEHGWQKPDPRMFATALELLDAPCDRTLMVGDRSSHDGGSVAVGVAAFILGRPPLNPEARGLEVVTRIVGA